MAIPLLFLQPSFFLLSSTVLTETLFALVFVIALRLHLSGRIRVGMIVASLLILVRPEGFFIGVLWGVWVLRIADCGLRIAESPRLSESANGLNVVAIVGANSALAIRNPQLLLLATGMILWWLAAYLISATRSGSFTTGRPIGGLMERRMAQGLSGGMSRCCL